MIKWYKRVYQVSEDERDSDLEILEIIDKLHGYFDKQSNKIFGDFKTAKNPYVFLNRGFNSFTISHTTKQWGAKDSRAPMVTLIEGQIFDLGEKRRIKLISQIPIRWILVPILTLLVMYSMAPFYAFFLSALIVVSMYIWIRHCAKLDLVDVDIELYKCLKK